MNVKMEALEKWVKDFFEHDASGHDWAHTDRVRNHAVAIAKKEGADDDLVEKAALLHDIPDSKFHATEEAGMRYLKEGMSDLGFSPDEITAIQGLIRTVSFKGGQNDAPDTLEGKIVQDADRIDAIGAIGIARCFMFAGNKGDVMHDPELSPRTSLTEASYRKERNTAVNHFYEKLLKLKDLMHTDTSKRIAEERHAFMERYLDQFFDEWNSLK
ncbi:HD domain-containing protein [Salisediminibacterium selenitireducens]|uniref:Metal dependent phosphohydrolase n=1 Tax=Bacillus selenitireducens (strain ATCC 700615 / DSM 15326 / MLS10) TaxID=439292 RepID=D6XUB9_BACIE|nr:HD domain-containing protein [Salisediminibacterium selenitireducens]ADH99405.1 metal dependent phosphohydrolase [[Bacillus] selenitireducens MLS10]